MNSPNESGNPYADFGPKNLQQQRVFQALRVGDVLYLAENRKLGAPDRNVQSGSLTIKAFGMGRITVQPEGGANMPMAIKRMKHMAKGTNCAVSFKSQIGTPGKMVDVLPDGKMMTEDGMIWMSPWEES